MNTDKRREWSNLVVPAWPAPDFDWLSVFIRVHLWLTLFHPHAAEADAVALAAGLLVVAVGRAAGVGAVGPRPAAQHALLGPLLVAGAAVGRGALVVGVPGVRRPLPDV